MARVALEGVSKRFAGSVSAVDNFSLEINEHEYLVLVGPSGCGKSTTLRMIAGLERPTSGEIRIGDQDVTNTPARGRNVALVFQNQPLFPHYSVEGNFAFGLRQRNAGDWTTSIWKRATKPRQAAESAVTRIDVKALVRQAARELGVEHLLDRMPRQLSGGERQRVALGRAVVRNPAVFLLDEPLSSLDANLRRELRGLLRRMHDASRAATIHVTHDQVEALALADRVAVMEGGRLRQVGLPLEIYDRPQNRFVAGFIGDPPMNLLAGRLVKGEKGWRFKVKDSSIEILGPAEQSDRFLKGLNNVDADLGLRPEHTEITTEIVADSDCRQVIWRVVRVEHLGSESFVYLVGGNEATSNIVEKSTRSNLISRIRDRAPFQPGQLVSVRCLASQTHWFDRRSAERIN